MSRRDPELIDAIRLQEPESDGARPTVDTLRRSQRYDRVRLDKLRIPPGEEDPQFKRLYLAFASGNAPVGSTRLGRAEIELGFRGTDGQLIIDDVPSDDLEIMRATIRAGARPALWVYPRAPSASPRYACPDDALLVNAYDAEGIAELPCFVLQPDPNALQHSAFIGRAISKAPGRPIAIESIMVPTEPMLARIVGDDIENGKADIRTAISQLHLQLLLALKRLRNFHRHGSAATHYHHSLSSAIARAVRLVTAMRRIGLATLPDAAAVLVRALYELWLSVYLDWLSPELVGSAFQIHATSTRGERKKAMTVIEAEQRASGWSKRDIEKIAASRERIFRLVESPSERASVNPGAILHSKIYPRLCEYAHQDFAAGSPFLGALSRRDSPARMPIESGEVTARFLLQVSDIAVAGIVSCVNGDTGDAKHSA